MTELEDLFDGQLALGEEECDIAQAPK
jgi:hypothetical protein